MPPWKTETVGLLLTAILTENAYDRLPILADALEEGGYDNGAVLHCLRGGDEFLNGPWVERLIVGSVSPLRVAESFAYLLRFADLCRDPDRDEPEIADHGDRSPKELLGSNVDKVNWVIATLRSYNREDADFVELGYGVHSASAMAYQELWNHFTVLTGETLIESRQYSYQYHGMDPFECAC